MWKWFMRNSTFLTCWEMVGGPAPAKMTRGRPGEGHPPDLVLKNGNSVAQIDGNLPPAYFWRPWLSNASPGPSQGPFPECTFCLRETPAFNTTG